jgi:NADPH-dependent 2,4-dienoyl-CoA reductase/sulfur reductase-like enzyme
MAGLTRTKRHVAGMATHFWRNLNAINDLSTSILERDVRQRGLVPPARLARCDAVVIGVGPIGWQAALQLAALGVSRLTLFDDDLAQSENLAPQGYWPLA